MHLSKTFPSPTTAPHQAANKEKPPCTTVSHFVCGSGKNTHGFSGIREGHEIPCPLKFISTQS